MRLKARDECTDESDGEHSQIHQIDGTVSDDASGRIYPEQDEACHAGNTDGGSVRNRAPLSCNQFISETRAEQEGTPESESDWGPVPSHEKVSQQGHEQDAPCH